MADKISKPLGILLVNLGTPDAPTASAIRRYLAEFLSDPRVAAIPRLIWLPILYGFILPFRSMKLVDRYAMIWRDEGAPIRVLTAELASRVEDELVARQINKILVRSAMTYGNPSIRTVLNELQQSGIKDLLVIPLFPQYSAATTAAVFDKLAKVISGSIVFPDIRFVTEYHRQRAYIEAITQSIKARTSEIPDDTKLVFSFHGLPESQIEKGDPYVRQCKASASAIAINLGLPDNQWQISYQSRFGPAWLKPYTSEVMGELPDLGCSKVVVVCPGFAVDCLETLEEIDVLNRRIFLEAGGKSFTYIPALNAEVSHVEVMVELIIEHLFRTEKAAD